MFFFGWVWGRGGRRDSNFLIKRVSWWSWSESGGKKSFPRFPQTQNSNEAWCRVHDPVCKMFYFGFQDTHKSKLKNKREGAPQVKSKKGEEREREGGRREDIKRKLHKNLKKTTKSEEVLQLMYRSINRGGSRDQPTAIRFSSLSLMTMASAAAAAAVAQIKLLWNLGAMEV